MKKPEEYLKEPYSQILIWDEESGVYFAQILEFPGCFNEGETPQEAISRLQETAINWISSAQNLGQEIPEPFPQLNCNGKVALRIPKSLHQQAMMTAQREGVSLNQFILTAVSEMLGATKAIDKMIEKKVQATLNVSSNIFTTYLDPKTASSTDEPLPQILSEPKYQYYGTSSKEAH